LFDFSISFSQKKELFDFWFEQPMPLRHIRIIVIWEGNYDPDILNIGRDVLNHELNFQGKI